MDLYPPTVSADRRRVHRRQIRLRAQRETIRSRSTWAVPKSTVKIAGEDVASAPQNVEAGDKCSPAASFDPEFRWWTLFNAIDWQTGKELTGAIVVGTRPSMLYNVLFGTLGTEARHLCPGAGGNRHLPGPDRTHRAVHRRAADAQHDEVGGRTLHRDAGREPRRLLASHPGARRATRWPRWRSRSTPCRRRCRS